MIRKTRNSMHNQSKCEHGASTSLHIVELAQKSLHKLQVTGRSGCIWRHGCFMPSNKNAPRAFSLVSIRWIPVRRQADGLLAATEACKTNSDPQQSDPSALTDNTTATSKNQPHTSRSPPELRLHTMAATRSKRASEPEL